MASYWRCRQKPAQANQSQVDERSVTIVEDAVSNTLFQRQARLQVPYTLTRLALFKQADLHNDTYSLIFLVQALTMRWRHTMWWRVSLRTLQKRVPELQERPCPQTKRAEKRHRESHKWTQSGWWKTKVEDTIKRGFCYGQPEHWHSFVSLPIHYYQISSSYFIFIFHLICLYLFLLGQSNLEPPSCSSRLVFGICHSNPFICSIFSGKDGWRPIAIETQKTTWWDHPGFGHVMRPELSTIL